MISQIQASTGKKAKRTNAKSTLGYRLIMNSEAGNGVNMFVSSLVLVAFLARRYEARMGMYLVDVLRPDGSSLFSRHPVIRLP